MVKMIPKDFDSVFTIDLLPVLIADDDNTFNVEPGETLNYTTDITSIIRNSGSSDDVKLALVDQLHAMQISGGVFASLSQSFNFNEFIDIKDDYLSISIDEQVDEFADFVHEKQIRFLLSGKPVKLDAENYTLVNEHCTSLIKQIFSSYCNKVRSLNENQQFVNKLFTDTSVVIDKNANNDFVIKLDPSLYKYFLTLTQR